MAERLLMKHVHGETWPRRYELILCAVSGEGSPSVERGSTPMSMCDRLC